MNATPRSVRSSVGRDDWREPAVRHVLADLGLPHDRLARIVDVRAVRTDEAWVAVEVDGRQVVVGLRREPCTTGDAGGSPDGWFRLLYLYEVAAVAPSTEAAFVGVRA
jgi:hypothetical protein